MSGRTVILIWGSLSVGRLLVLGDGRITTVRILASLKTGFAMALGNARGPVGRSTSVSGARTSSRGSGSTHTAMAESTKVNSPTIVQTARAPSSGQTGPKSTAHLKTVESTDQRFLSRRMGQNIGRCITRISWSLVRRWTPAL
jgi:hypothetical protein